MPLSQYVSFLACVGRFESITDVSPKNGAQIRSGKQKAATRYTHAGVHTAHHPVYNKVVAYIARCSCPLLPLCVLSYTEIPHTHTHARTRVRRELLRRRGFDQADSKGCNPLLPVATDVRHV